MRATKTTQQSLKDVEVQVDEFGKESKAKAKGVAARGCAESEKLNAQSRQVQDEKDKLLQTLTELEHSTDEISQRAVAQQELVKNSHEEAETNVMSKQRHIRSYWWYVMNPAAGLDTSR